MLDEYEKKITSEYNEDGVLSNIFNRLPKNKYDRRFYVYLRDHYKKRNIMRNLILNYNFTSAISFKEYVDGIVPCTIDGIKQLFSQSSNFVFKNIDLLAVECIGTDFWILKTFMEQCTRLSFSKPNVIVVRYNYIMGPTKSIAVPYINNINKQKNININYTGASLQAYISILKDYVFIGCIRLAFSGFFIKRSLICGNSKLMNDAFFSEANIDYCFSYPNVVYGMKKRWPLVNKKFWLTVK